MDYPSAFTMFNRWGDFYKLLHAGGFWNLLSENTSKRTIVAKHLAKSGTEIHGLNIEVNNTNGSIEGHPIASHREYLKVYNDVSETVKALEVEEFNRLGVRFTFLEPIASFKDAFDPIVDRISKDYRDLFEEPPRDIAITSIHGSREQSMRIAVGPISKDEYGSWFTRPDEIEIKNAILLDVDCFAFGYKFKNFDFSKIVEFYFDKAFTQGKKVVDFLKGME